MPLARLLFRLRFSAADAAYARLMLIASPLLRCHARRRLYALFIFFSSGLDIVAAAQRADATL